jgi:hypothetical protein
MGEVMRTWSLLELGALLVFAAVGCRDNTLPGTGEPMVMAESRPVRTVIDTKAGRFTSSGAGFDASFHDPPVGPTYELTVSGRDGGDASTWKMWDLTLWPTPEQIEAESAEVPVVVERGVKGAAMITLYWAGAAPGEQLGATSGTVSVTFGHGQVQGTATAVPDELSGTFQSSSLGLNCTVPLSMLDAGGAPGPVLDGAGSLWVGLQDKDLVTPFCAGLRHLITP